ncbi:MAG: carboxypeptidase-like regulatory domain-containing protein, partial [Bacteroidetes bacterium]|nr:carboxypeptidase-like regulatory domain-containing protein [Bacteroidota bacterium]
MKTQQQFLSTINLILFFLPFLTVSLAAQTTTMRGIVRDQQSETPLIGATVQVLGADAGLGASTDANGNFVIKNVPVGRQALK